MSKLLSSNENSNGIRWSRCIFSFFNAVASFSTRRSPGWKKLRTEHLKRNPKCAVCGSRLNLIPHHIVPFHLDRSKELDPSNLITLCENKSLNCHLLFGHLKSWSRYNPDIVEDAKVWNKKLLPN